MSEEEKIHEELNSRIREVFDNFEDTSADEGWALLRQKFPEKKKDRGLAWLWYAAAAIVLLCFGVWFMQKPEKAENPVATNIKPVVQPKTDTQPVVVAPADKDTLQSVPQNNIAQIVHKPGQVQTGGSAQTSAQLAGLQNKNVPQHPSLPVTGHEVLVPSNNAALSQQNNKAINTIAANSKKDSATTAVKNAALAAVDQPVEKQIDSATKANTAKYAANTPLHSEKPSSAAAMNKLLAETLKDKDDKKSRGPKKTIFSIYAATYFNYAKGSDNNINVGAGFSSDFRITNNLKLSTGVAIAQNSLKYNNNGSGQASFADAPVQSTLATVTAAAPTTLKSSNNSLFASAISVNIPPSLRNYNASLIGLDVPVNLKYLFDPQKTDAFVSAGISSGTYINETYITNYTYARAEQQSTIKANFNSFDIAKTLNVSFGVGYPLGKSNRLIVEPFLKYPLDGLGSQQIKFGSGGINLKLNFQPAKK